jgi:hypothetical protein
MQRPTFSFISVPNEFMRRCLLRWLDESLSPEFQGLWRIYARLSFIPRIRVGQSRRAVNSLLYTAPLDSEEPEDLYSTSAFEHRNRFANSIPSFSETTGNYIQEAIRTGWSSSCWTPPPADTSPMRPIGGRCLSVTQCRLFDRHQPAGPPR